MEFKDGKVAHETHYYADPFKPPEWRSQWVENVFAESPMVFERGKIGSSYNNGKHDI